jgi:hypothetical protein
MFLCYCFFFPDKTIRKSFASDEYLASTNNNIYDGGTYSNSWAADGRDKGINIENTFWKMINGTWQTVFSRGVNINGLINFFLCCVVVR